MRRRVLSSFIRGAFSRNAIAFRSSARVNFFPNARIHTMKRFVKATLPEGLRTASYCFSAIIAPYNEPIQTSVLLRTYRSIDQSKRVMVPAASIWDKVKYVLCKFFGIVLASACIMAIGYAVHAWDILEQWQKISLCVAAPASFIASIYGFLSGGYLTVESYRAWRIEGLGSPFSFVVKKHGLQHAATFLTPREIRRQFLEEALSAPSTATFLYKDWNLGEMYALKILSQDELEKVRGFIADYKSYKSVYDANVNKIQSELDKEMSKYQVARDLIIKEARAEYNNSSEVAFQASIEKERTKEVNKLRSKQNNEVAEIDRITGLTAAAKAHRKDQIRAKYRKKIVRVESEAEFKTRSNLANLDKKGRERDRKISEAKEAYRTVLKSVQEANGIDSVLRSLSGQFTRDISELDRDIDMYLRQLDDTRTVDSVECFV
eukprot:TRINITY_DN14474_c0_g1_i1.p1 TRINITY_DN14474_c0_g1~~TRINITY_DN14474_c0_g1_i1.p1  ORF type:complete len:434 (+),score=53.87 TRINITY_DN14474_c0_g1_i1:35-1336(+)